MKGFKQCSSTHQITRGLGLALLLERTSWSEARTAKAQLEKNKTKMRVKRKSLI